MALEIGLPGHQGPVVVGAKVVPVLHDKIVADRLANLGDGGQSTIRENMPVDPRIAVFATVVGTDAVQQKQPAVAQAPLHHGHVGGVVLPANVFKHAQRHDMVEGLIEVAVVLQTNLHRQALATPPGQLGLLAGDRDADHLRTVTLGGELGKTAPAAADIQHPFTGLQADLAADQIQLVLLSLRKVGGTLPVATGVGHV